MPFDKTALADGLEAVAAESGTATECAQAWADAVEAYATGVVPPSTTVGAAAGTLSTALAAAFATPAAAALMEAAFAAFAVTMGGGMAGHTPAPPPAPVGFAALFLAPKPATHEDGGAAVADLIDAWATTGTATLVAPPNTVLSWS